METSNTRDTMDTEDTMNTKDAMNTMSTMHTKSSKNTKSQKNIEKMRTPHRPTTPKHGQAAYRDVFFVLETYDCSTIFKKKIFKKHFPHFPLVGLKSRDSDKERHSYDTIIIKRI